MLQTILYGNGLNLLSKGAPSWDELLKGISNGFDAVSQSDIPNTLKYEGLLMDSPYRSPSKVLMDVDNHILRSANGSILKTAGQLTEEELKNKIANQLQSFSSNSMYGFIASLPVSNYLTTNYDNTLLGSFSSYNTGSKFRAEKIYSIRRYYDITTYDGSSKRYWPIHGNVESPASIMLGYDHYCGSLAKIESYVKGSYELNKEKVDSIEKRLSYGISDYFSWIDLFFISDVHIIGFGLKYDEIDLWWLLNKRRRIMRANPDLIKNKVIYYQVDPISDGMSEIFTRFGVEVKPLDRSIISTADYSEKYHSQLSSMRSLMEDRM